MLNIIQFGNFKPKGKQKRKKQIVLCHTSREVQDPTKLNGKILYTPSTEGTMYDMVHHCIIDGTITRFVQKEKRKVIFKFVIIRYFIIY